MLRNLPAVGAVFHESIGETTFRSLGQDLGVDLGSAMHCYDSKRVRHYTLDDIPGHARESVKAVMDLYDNLRQHAIAGFESIQLEQNARHLDARHFTPLGALQRDVERLLRQL
jgi:hypothetical protein